MFLGCICIAFLTILSIKLFELLFPKSTYYQQQNKQRQTEMNKYAHIGQSNPNDNLPQQVDYSILYSIFRRSSEKIELLSVKHQIESISKLMIENFGESTNFEIVCVIDPSDQKIFRYLCSLYQEHNYITPVLKDTKGLHYFINGLVYSHGEIIIDSRFICDAIDDVKNIEKDKPFVEFYEPRILNRSFISSKSCYLQPILMTRNAGDIIFNYLHNTGNGSSHEILYICQQYNIEMQTRIQNIGNTSIPIIKQFCTKINEYFTDILYHYKRWTLKNDQYQDA